MICDGKHPICYSLRAWRHVDRLPGRRLDDHCSRGPTGGREDFSPRRHPALVGRRQLHSGRHVDGGESAAQERRRVGDAVGPRWGADRPAPRSRRHHHPARRVRRRELFSLADCRAEPLARSAAAVEAVLRVEQRTDRRAVDDRSAVVVHRGARVDVVRRGRSNGADLGWRCG